MDMDSKQTPGYQWFAKTMSFVQRIPEFTHKGWVADVGCGSGWHSLEMSKNKDLKILAIDRVPKFLRVDGRQNKYGEIFKDYPPEGMVNDRGTIRYRNVKQIRWGDKIND